MYSARYAGVQRDNMANIQLLLEKLKDKDNRMAQFRTVITLINPSGKVKQFEGVVKGTILTEMKGTEGFGYDPVFAPKGYQQTFAEMSSDQKNAISHRGIAIRKLVDFLSKQKQE